MQFDLSTTDEQSVSGTYRVAGDCYFIALSEARVYCDGTVRYEVSDRAHDTVLEVECRLLLEKKRLKLE